MAISVTSCGMQGVTPANEEKPEGARGTVLMNLTLEGGTGRATIISPAEITEKDGKLYAKLVWSSKNYDYMIVGGQRYENENPGGDSTFTVLIDDTENPLPITADTVAMSVPHEIEYVINWKGPAGDSVPGTISGQGTSADGNSIAAGYTPEREAVRSALSAAGLERTATYDLKYAKCFQMEKYGDILYVSIDGSGDYVVLPQDMEAPAVLPENVTVLNKPLDNTYMVSTSAMDLACACGASGMIRLSGTKAEDWYIDAAKSAMQDGKMIYAGKYRAPDYELILENGCSLAVENTMIYHEPAVKEKLEELGIPVLVETSSYEEHPLGRLEWIKLYGALFDREDEAADFFEGQMKLISPLLEEKKDTGRSVAFFYVTANGMINVRRPGDYITKMIEMAGCRYVPDTGMDDGSASSSVNMQMEDFYSAASSADIIIYSSTIGGGISSVKELTDKNPLFGDFKAVKDSAVYCTERSLFQEVTGSAEFIRDLNGIANGEDREYTYLNKLE
ncbi:MAG: ABC transporter substrate-binding protein [Lachnospiraceae bacterium]|nr:ABC transporter substrate-binding protein [Lachnospiraceae bacterium]